MEGMTFFIETKGFACMSVCEEILNEEKGIAPHYHVEMPVKHLRHGETGWNLCPAHFVRNHIAVFLVPRSKNAEGTHRIFSPHFFI